MDVCPGRCAAGKARFHAARSEHHLRPVPPGSRQRLDGVVDQGAGELLRRTLHDGCRQFAHGRRSGRPGTSRHGLRWRRPVLFTERVRQAAACPRVVSQFRSRHGTRARALRSHRSFVRWGVFRRACSGRLAHDCRQHHRGALHERRSRSRRAPSGDGCSARTIFRGEHGRCSDGPAGDSTTRPRGRPIHCGPAAGGSGRGADHPGRVSLVWRLGARHHGRASRALPGNWTAVARPQHPSNVRAFRQQGNAAQQFSSRR